MHRHRQLTASIALGALVACSPRDDTAIATANAAHLTAPAKPTPGPIATASAAPAVAGFDPDSAPIGTAPPGAWPYFGMMEGYVKFDSVNIAGSENKKYLEDVPYDRWEFFDGSKMILVEGRTLTTGGKGDGASFFQIQKTYEKLVHDLGGVTVYEGTGKPLKDKGLMFADRRYRANYAYEDDQMGVYMLRTPSTQIWIEVYHPWEDSSHNYWLTIVEKEALQVTVKLIPAAEMKEDLDAAGHVALYLNFDTDQSAINPAAQPVIAEIVKLLRANPSLKLTVEGHTDSAGTAAHNQALSDGRAGAVVAAIVAQGIAPSRLQAQGHGQNKPIADNGSEEGRAKNRRVELVKR